MHGIMQTHQSKTKKKIHGNSMFHTPTTSTKYSITPTPVPHAIASSASVPITDAALCILTLLRAVSEEEMHLSAKEKLRAELKRLTQSQQTQAPSPAAPSVSLPLTLDLTSIFAVPPDADVPVAPALDSLPTGPPSRLLKELSVAASVGVISHTRKIELKNMVLISRRAPTRMQRQISAEDLRHARNVQAVEKKSLRFLYGKRFTDLTVAAFAAAEGRMDLEPFGGVYAVRVKPSPSTNCRGVSAVIRFNLPVRYPFTPPAMKVVKMKGHLVTDADSMMLGTHMNGVINKLYGGASERERGVTPPPPCLVVLLDAARDFLDEFSIFLAERHAIQARKDAEAELQSRHAAAVLARMELEQVMTHHRDYSQPSSTFLETQAAQEEAKIAEKKARDALEATVAAYQARLENTSSCTTSSSSSVVGQSDATGSTCIPDSAWQDGGFSQTFLDLLPTPEAIIAMMEAADPQWKSSLGVSADDVRLIPIVSPFLAWRFMNTLVEYQAAGHGEIEYAYHGCSPEMRESIETNGLIVPGQVIPSTGEILAHRTDSGYFGEGIYTSPHLGYTAGYGSINNTFVLMVLRGRCYPCPHNEGCQLESGFDSHMSQCGSEWVFFDSSAVLPIYRIIQPSTDSTTAKPFSG